MRVAVLEFETHSHLLPVWYELFQDTGIDFHFFVSEIISNQIKEIHESQKSIISFSGFPNLHQNLKNYDLVIFNTLHRNFEKFNSVFSNYKTLILVHNANFYFHSLQPEWNLLLKTGSLNLTYYYLKLVFKEKIYKTKNIIRQATAYGFLNSEVFEKNKITGKQNFVIPLIYQKFNNPTEKRDIINIVIPGEVSQNRRDYFLIFNLIKNLNPKQKLHFTFLGKSINPEINKTLENLQKKQSSNIYISFFKERISQEEFDQYMNEAHFVLCPLHRETQFYLQKEIYGQTKASGNEADCISYNKIGVFPDYYPVANGTCLYYKNQNDLKVILENLTFEKYKFYQQELIIQSSFFSKENAQKKLLGMINSLVNT